MKELQAAFDLCRSENACLKEDIKEFTREKAVLGEKIAKLLMDMSCQDLFEGEDAAHAASEGDSAQGMDAE